MNRDLLLVAFSLFLWGLGESSFFNLQSLYLEQLGADAITIGVVFSIYGLAGTLAHMPAGYLADKIGRKPLLIAGWFIGLISMIVMTLASKLGFFITGMVMYGATMFVIAPLNAYVTAARGKWSVQRILTLISIAFNLGAVIGPGLGGWIGERYGLRTVFAVAVCIFFPSNLIIYSIRPQPIEKRQPGDEQNKIFRNTKLLGFLLVLFVATFAMYLPQPLTPNFLQGQRNFTIAQIGRLYSINSIGIIAFNLLLGQLNPQKGFFLGQLSVVVFSVILWKTIGLPWYAMAFFILAGFRLARLMAIAQVRQLIHQADMGVAYALAETLSSFSIILAPLLAGFLYSSNPLGIFRVGIILVGLSLTLSAIYSFLQRKYSDDIN